jgi:hypothetical protein
MRYLFPGQQDDEEIVLVVRQHWIYLTEKVLIWLVFVAILFFFDYVIANYFPALLNKPGLDYINLIKNIYVMFLVLSLFTIWTIHYLTVWVVTNKRVVNITQPAIFAQRISELTFPNIEDISSDTRGIFATMFSYGSVEIETAGEHENFIFEKIPHPKDMERLIFNLMGKHPEQGNE